MSTDMDAEKLLEKIEPPTEPGFYKYSGARQTSIFCLDSLGNWWVIVDNGHSSRCAWSYIEQCLSVWTLEKIE